MPYFDCDFTEPEIITDEPKILFLQVMEPEYLLIRVTESTLFKQFLKP